MIAEGIASFMKLRISSKPSLEKPVQVLEQAGENLMYAVSKSALTQYDIPFATAAPLLPNPDLNTRIQHKRI